LLFVALWILILAPLKVFSGECEVASLKITLSENREYQVRKPNGTQITSSFNKNAKGHVMFYIDKSGKLNIISKSLNGELSGESYTDTGCAHHESYSRGTLIEGRMSSKGIYTVYWKVHTEFKSNYKNTRGCMKQSPVSGSNNVEQVEPLFECIIHPVSKIKSLCNSAGRNPKLGYCKQTPNGYYGTLMEKSNLPGEGVPRLQTSIVYEWSVEKVPCEKHKCIEKLIKNMRLASETFKDLIERCNIHPNENYFCNDVGQLNSCINNSSSPKEDFGCFSSNCDFGGTVPLVISDCVQYAINSLRHLQNTARKEYKKCMNE